MEQISAFTTFEYELFAPVSLLRLYPSLVNNLVKGESPDWQDDIRGIGLEVVRAENQQIGFTKYFSNKYHGKSLDDIPPEEINKLGDIPRFRNGKLYSVSLSGGLVDGNTHIKIAAEKAKDKLDLLNREHFKRFDRNCLYIFLTASLTGGDPDEFLDMYLKLAEEYPSVYSDVFLMDNYSIHRINVINRQITKHDLSGSELKKLQREVHLLSRDGKWKNGTPFLSTYRDGLNLKTKTLKKSSVLQGKTDEIFALLKKLETLQYIARPYAAFRPIDEKQPLIWTEGATFRFRFRLFCFIPCGIHTVHVIRFNDETHDIYTNEFNTHVPIWNHRIIIRSVDGERTEYTDEVEIGAGWKTVFVYAWARCFYAHRQKKWIELIEKEKARNK